MYSIYDRALTNMGKVVGLDDQNADNINCQC